MRSQAQKTELLTVYLNNGGVEDMVKSQNNVEVINVSKTTKDDKIEFEVTVSLYSRPNDRFFFQITKKQDFQRFFSQIKDAFELKYDYFKGLKGLRVKNLRVKPNNLLLGFGLNEKQPDLLISTKMLNESVASHAVAAAKQEINMDQMRKIEVENQEDLVSNALKTLRHERLYVEMESQDLWLQVKMKMKNSDVCFISDFDIKSDCSMNGKDLKRVIQKLAISIWNDLIKMEEKDMLNTRTAEQQMDDLISPAFDQQESVVQGAMVHAVQSHILTNIEIFKLEVLDQRERGSHGKSKDKRKQSTNRPGAINESRGPWMTGQ